jgi:hypothetical protein
MRTYHLHSHCGDITGFEVSNTWLQPRAASRLLTDNGATVTFRRGFLRPGNVHVRFQYCGHQFELVEPFGDSSRYDIVPAAGHRPPAAILEEIRGIFIGYRPGVLGVLRSLLGG